MKILSGGTNSKEFGMGIEKQAKNHYSRTFFGDF